VALLDTDAHGRRTWRAVNACLVLMPMLAGREVVSAEGLTTDGEPHPVQKAMVDQHGSQCGYCTPGFVMSMFEGYYRDDLKESWQIADQLCGNLCRCTGYRPIRDAMCDALDVRETRKSASDRFRLPLADGAHAELGSAPAQYEHPSRDERFLYPTTLDELVALKDKHPGAALVAGATEVGVDINKKYRRFKTLISIERVGELRRVTKTDREWVVGGAATLTALEEALAGEIPALGKMLLVFASRQIRNRATLAGNVVTASPIGDMPPVLLALGADVVLRSSRWVRSVPIEDFFTGYRQTAMRPDEIIESIVIPRGPAQRGWTRRADSYKVSKRRELDISIVAAAFCVDLDASNVVRHAALAYGGVAATPVRAKQAEAALVGKPWTRATIDAVLPVLEAEFKPIADVRSGDEFRRGLIASLFEKFFEGGTSLSQDLPLDFQRGARWNVRDESKALRHESALGHATGAALYVDDQAERRPMLEIWPVCSPHAHAKIVRRDATKARAMPGVAAVLMAEDIPGLNDVGVIRHDETLLADQETLFHGHMVAVVVADTYEHARTAAAAVEVEYEPLPAVLGLEDAIAKGSYHTEPHRIRRGDTAQAMASAPRALEGTLTIGGQEHFYLETHAAWAEVGEDGEVFVCASTQHPSEIQAMVAHVLDLPRHKVVVQSPRMGGGFGGKETQGNTWASLAALAAQKTGRPVRVQLDRDLDMSLTGKRHPFHARYRAGFDTDGRLLAVAVELTSDGGWALDLSESICDRALFHLDNAYFIPSVDFVGRVAKTNAVSHTAFRGFGGPQGMVVIEEVIDRVARNLGLRPETVRERNLYRGDGETATTHYGELIPANRIPKIWSQLKASAEFDARREAVAQWNAAHPRVKRGLAITPVKFGISFTASWLNQAGAYVLMYRDGTVQVNHGGTEMGQGLHTKVLGVAMRELGLPSERVRVMKTQTDKVPNTSATAASAGADLNGAAVRAACETLRARLAEVAAGMLGCAPEAVTFRDARAHHGAESIEIERVCELAYSKQVQLAASGFYRTPGIHYDRVKGRGTPFYYYAFGAAVSEVEVDGYSGMKRVVRVDILHDVGDSLNPGVDRGQIEGAFVQGVGWLTGEELKWDAAGRLSTHSASTYQIPAVSDAPVDLRVELLGDAAQDGTIHGSKAVGEPPLMLAISVREALRDAVAAFGEGGGDIALASPATHEAIYKAVRDRLREGAKAREAAA
jgi:xanthine dehydrogenase molybdopterin binding subunit/xanthine dehydrogenase small subunit